MGSVARSTWRTQRRKEIFDAAISLTKRHDLASLRISDVAAELGLTANAVRHYFRNMRELLSTLQLLSDVRFYCGYYGRLATMERTENPRERLALIIAAGLQTGAGRC
jgi:AcrR family transcriptional regulator